jgi:hypothetical protein
MEANHNQLPHPPLSQRDNRNNEESRIKQQGSSASNKRSPPRDQSPVLQNKRPRMSTENELQAKGTSISSCPIFLDWKLESGQHLSQIPVHEEDLPSKCHLREVLWWINPDTRSLARMEENDPFLAVLESERAKNERKKKKRCMKLDARIQARMLSIERDAQMIDDWYRGVHL